MAHISSFILRTLAAIVVAVGAVSDGSPRNKESLRLESRLQTCSLRIEKVNGESVAVRYAGLPANQPKSYANFLAIWRSSVIPWTVEPLRREGIRQNSQMGSHVIGDTTITGNAYIVAYAVGDRISNICASAPIAAVNRHHGTYVDAVRISIARVGANSLAVNYHTLLGYLPGYYKNWVGLWKGQASPYNASRPLGTAIVRSDSSQGTIAINGIEIGNNQLYTLIYFMGGERGDRWPRSLTSAAAILTFKIEKRAFDSVARIKLKQQ